MTEEALKSLLNPEALGSLVEKSLASTANDVERALSSGSTGFQEYLALISPAAEKYIEKIARRAERITRERFGRVVGLYAPVYISNECTNSCVYCGFNRANDLRRATLSPSEIRSEAEILWKQGFRNVLLVSGEHPGKVPVEKILEAAGAVRDLFPSISVEVYPMETGDYAKLSDAGVEGVTIYQETYDPAIYAAVHPQGRKSDFAWRLDTPSRVGGAGMRRMGIGALLGLGPWRLEAVALALHAGFLQKKYWRTALSISFPRLRAAAGGYAPRYPVTDREMVQMSAALRLLNPDAGLVLSTRESSAFRDGLVPICITMMSAGSRTEPGGYANPGDAGEQFCVEDRRSPAEIASMLKGMGLEPVWKDWDRAYSSAGET